MKILHITPHFGGGVGSCLLDWMEWLSPKDRANHTLMSLDYLNPHAERKLKDMHMTYGYMQSQAPHTLRGFMEDYDIILVHWWDHHMLRDLFHDPIPPCRMISWAHKQYAYHPDEKLFPDKFIYASPSQAGISRPVIRSTRNMQPFLDVKPRIHEGFNVGYCGTVDYKKLHKSFIPMCTGIRVPGIRFTVLGQNNINEPTTSKIWFAGHVNDVPAYLANMDVFGYPLNPKHYGTSEIALGEAMCAGIPVVVMNNPAEASVVVDGCTGFVAEDCPQYEDRIEYLYANPIVRQDMGYYARLHAKDIYSIRTMNDAWERQFQQIIHQPKRGRAPLI